ncbi:putative zinc-binding protein (Yippee) [Trypanosoma conorhini]|uniref:Putative zinc-binding protein (Yippee) n=1 Tax=Trypanosoma conorhini TaxID=83891 RepID=A0A422NNN0_9TRYP|nr:putative zinc-binding protein (Yippee) [Trypanosoma conorhini]RNF06979.1 putative zinc-binding protein (Yippee) [Trypanosoma conorhini]
MGGSLRVLADHVACDEGREQSFWRWIRRKRQRSPSVDEGCNVTATRTPDNEAEKAEDAEAQSLLRMQVLGTDGVRSVPLGCSVLCGPSVEDTYGCHYHVYPSTSPGAAHGTALCWSLRRSSLTTHALMCLGRVANSCRKDLVLFDEDVGILLSYTTRL